MNTCHALLFAALGCIISAEALSRPVSYAGGWTLIGESDRQSSSALLHYTPTYKWSLGPRLEVNRDDHFSLTTLHATRLAKRWFGSDHQGNLYFFGGAGMASGVDSNRLEDRFAAYGGVMADWETRSLFTSYRARYLEASHFGKQFMHAARVGFAPYEGDTGALHTWLMLEIDHRPSDPDSLTATPLLRLFKGPLLVEAGYNISVNQPLLNFTYRF